MNRLSSIATGFAIALATCHASAAVDTHTPAGAGTTPADSGRAPAIASPSQPTFDCAKAEWKVEKLVCQDGNLARMDREVERLYRLALRGSHMTTTRAAELRRDQKNWVRDRNECWKGIDLRQCTMTSYARRIHQLRQAYADARTRDSEGISIGPVAYQCTGLDALIGATCVNSDPGAVYLEWMDYSMALDHVPSGSGAKYSGDGTMPTGSLGPEARRRPSSVRVNRS